jgi:2-polyprenyl-3-methyl-5-hydroxy-6-metoxy-1,4-benzoquinol methylase
MERLSFTSRTGYNATEAAIHMARYLLAAPYARGRRVLDAACGEGYGAFALKLFGAKSVDAIDIAPEAIKVARTLFASKDVTYHVHDAERLDQLFPKRSFDLIVALETIEHVRDPERFLTGIKAVAKRDAVIVISCPNDHWYYKEDSQSNPFHVRKYTFEQFRELTSSLLGGHAVWGYGVPIVGFGNIRDDLSAGRDPITGQAAMLDFRPQASAVALPPRAFANVGPRNCSYFVGIWGGKGSSIYTAAFAPISMDQYSNLVSWDAANLSPQQIKVLERENARLRSTHQNLEASLDEVRERYRAALEKAQVSDAKLGETMLLAEERHKEIERLSEQVKLLERSSGAETVDRKHAATLANMPERRHSSPAEELSVEEVEGTVKNGSYAVDNSFEGDSYRIQALALAKELEVARRQVDELGCERDRILVELQTYRATTAAAQEGIADHKRNEEDIGPGLDQMQERESYRIQALALSKELEVSNCRIGELASERDSLAAKVEAHERAQEAWRQETVEQNRKLEEMHARLEKMERECESRRIQAVALARELEVSNRRISELASERDRALAELQACRVAEVAARQNSLEKDRGLHEIRSQPHRISNGRDNGSRDLSFSTSAGHGSPGAPSDMSEGATRPNQRRVEEGETAEMFRIQALALSKELTIATGRIEELMRERERMLADPSSGIASLLKEKRAFDRQLNTVMKVSGGPKPAVQARLSAATKSGLRRVARRIRPYLPHRLLSAAQAVARSLGM